MVEILIPERLRDRTSRQKMGSENDWRLTTRGFVSERLARGGVRRGKLAIRAGPDALDATTGADEKRS